HELPPSVELVSAAAVASFRRLLHRAINNAHQSSGKARHDFTDRLGRLELMRHHLLGGRSIREWKLTSQTVIKYAAETVLIPQRRQVSWIHNAFGTGTIQAAGQGTGGRHRIDQ